MPKAVIFSKYALSAVSLLGLIFITVSCGKVAQEVVPTNQDPKIFNLSYTVFSPTTENIQALLERTLPLNVAGLFSTQDTRLTVQVLGIRKDGKQEELSWGRGLLSFDKWVTMAVSGNQTVKKPAFKTESYNKSGVKVTAPDYTWTKLAFDSDRNLWRIDSVKLKRAYPLYLVKVVANKNKYLFKLVEDTAVSGNQSLSLNEITPFDTFLASLYLSDVAANSALSDTTRVKDFERVFDYTFFTALNPSLPDNKIEKYDEIDPQFTLQSTLMTELLKIYALARSDKTEAISYVEKSKLKELSSDAKKVLQNNIRSLKSS